MAMKPPQK